MKKDRSAKCVHWESLSNTSAVLAGCHILGPCHAASDAASRWGVTPLQVGPLFVINPCAGNMGTCRHHHWPLGRGQVGILNFYIDTCLAANSKATFWVSLLFKLKHLILSTVRPSKSGSKSCQTWPFLFSKYGYQELVCTRTSGWLYPCVNIHMVVMW